ncbi:biopolymer transporter ExbD [Halarcobacter mediterraneus]|uniref:Biopolymer transporter ExbD n=1 Tax=Halarcobacter mediterraneus TaxID=2023153 RepID=A0A4Q1ATC0_9BACT|nr:biopolymer transporter ExbD [Halarcobacter mediterraneus]RXK13023.1 biopolymer transporter ExbD [Halarcobacter mediterraneus]
MFDYNQKPDLNITPLVDIMLVLLAILMVTAPVVEFEEAINLPKGSKSQQIKAVKKIDILLTKDKEIKINKKSFEFSDFADNFVLFAESMDRKTPIHIRAEKTLMYDDVIYILRSVKEAGFTKVSLITDG